MHKEEGQEYRILSLRGSARRKHTHTATQNCVGDMATVGPYQSCTTYIRMYLQCALECDRACEWTVCINCAAVSHRL